MGGSSGQLKVTKLSKLEADRLQQAKARHRQHLAQPKVRTSR
jgi:hypothetical protein